MMLIVLHRWNHWMRVGILVCISRVGIDCE